MEGKEEKVKRIDGTHGRREGSKGECFSHLLSRVLPRDGDVRFLINFIFLVFVVCKAL